MGGTLTREGWMQRGGENSLERRWAMTIRPHSVKWVKGRMVWALGETRGRTSMFMASFARMLQGRSGPALRHHQTRERNRRVFRFHLRPKIPSRGPPLRLPRTRRSECRRKSRSPIKKRHQQRGQGLMGKRNGCLYHTPPRLSTRHHFLDFEAEAEEVLEGVEPESTLETVSVMGLIKELHSL